jgi:phosphoribosylanthranilate isomerase
LVQTHSAELLSQIKELEEENARLLASGQAMQAQHAESKEAQEEAQRMLAVAQQRESDMAMLLESTGINALTNMPIDWSVPEARSALQKDEEDQIVLERYAATWAAPPRQ